MTKHILGLPLILVALACLSGFWGESILLYSTDYLNYLPQMYTYENSSLYPADVFVQHLAQSGFHNTFVWPITALPGSIETIIVILGLIFRALYILGFFCLAKYIGKNDFLAFLSGLFALVTPGAYGSQTVFYGDAVSLVHMTFPWFVLATLWLRKKWGPWCVFFLSIPVLVILGLLHPMTGLALGLFAPCYLLLFDKRKWIAWGTLVALALATLALVPHIGFPFTDETRELYDQNYTEARALIDFSFRSTVLHFPIVFAVLISLAGIVLEWKNTWAKEISLWMALLFGYLITGMVLYQLSAAYFALLAVRIFSFVGAFSPLFFSSIVGWMYKYGKILGVVFALGILIFAGITSPHTKYYQKRFFSSGSYEQLCERSSPSAAALFKCSSAEGPWSLKKKEALIDVCNELRTAENDILILALPEEAMVLRVCARKSVVVTSKDHAVGWYSPELFREQQARILDVTDAYEQGHVADIAREYNATHIVVSSENRLNSTAWKSNYRNEFYDLYIKTNTV